MVQEAGRVPYGKSANMTNVICFASVIIREPEILGGTACFRGTRVPLKILMDYVEGGYPLGEFLEDFPSVSREMAIQALEEAKESLLLRIA